MLQSKKLQNLIEAGNKDEAIILCREQINQGKGSSYYKFWLRKLESDGAVQLSPPRPVPYPVQNDLQANLGDVALQIAENFKESSYLISPAASSHRDLSAERQELVASLPFKGDIYLPTAKIPLVEQVKGLYTVKSLLLPHNLGVTKSRFSSLKRLLAAKGRSRVFVIGNGPSLKKTDLELLKDEITIGFNGIFLHPSFVPTIYVVEDHLVAEDRVNEIHAYKCPVKVFPSYLAYCIQPQDNTIFLNHLPRISYPVDTDFSADAGSITYAGGTVTYTGLQLAASLGFKEIILVGVDASYQVHNVVRSETYGTGVLTSRSDDTNHFDSRYFGKGYRWHDPNVDKMLQAYRKAKYWALENGVKIKNATLGGQLEVFPRVDFHQLFPDSRSYPAVAVIDFTSIKRLCATGIVKRNLFEDWPVSSLLHVHSDNSKLLSAFQSCDNDLYEKGRDEYSVWAALRSLIEFGPEVLYLRPTPDCAHVTVLQVIATVILDVPYTLHYMDDWLEKVRASKSEELAGAYERLMTILCTKAAKLFSICPKMSRFMARKYSVEACHVESVHNFIQESFLPSIMRRDAQAGYFLVRFFGGLEADMGLATLVKVAQQIEDLVLDRPTGDMPAIRFEIYTAQHYINKHKEKFEKFSSTSLKPQAADYKEYLDLLASSNLNLISYNFDENSVQYVRYSMANKLPELLSVPVPFLAIGHTDIGTIELLNEVDYPLVFSTPEFNVVDGILPVLRPSKEFEDRYQAAHAKLVDEFSGHNNKHRLYCALRRVREKGSSPRFNPVEIRVLFDALSSIQSAAQPAWKEKGDLNLACNLLFLEGEARERLIKKVKAHGLTWSARDLALELKKVIKSSRDLATSTVERQVDALALLICGLRSDRYEEVNKLTAEWILGLPRA